MSYEHTQRSPLGLLLILIATVILVAGREALDSVPGALILTGTTVSLALAGMCFGRLTIRDEGERLAGTIRCVRRCRPFASRAPGCR